MKHEHLVVLGFRVNKSRIIRQSVGLPLVTSTFKIVHGNNSTIINSFDKNIILKHYFIITA